MENNGSRGQLVLTPEVASVLLGVLTNVLLEPVSTPEDLTGLIQALRDNLSIAQEQDPVLRGLSDSQQRVVQVFVDMLIEFVEGSARLRFGQP